MCLTSLLNTMEKLELAEVFSVDKWELRVLDEFIANKERCGEIIERGKELASHR